MTWNKKIPKSSKILTLKRDIIVEKREIISFYFQKIRFYSWKTQGTAKG